jgi:hypothetical protein
MYLARVSGFFLAVMLTCSAPCRAQAPAAPQSETSPESIAQLLEHVRGQDARLKQLEAEVARLKGEHSHLPAAAAPMPNAEAAVPPQVGAPAEAPPPPISPLETSDEGPEHTMKMPGNGPALKIRAFADFDLGFGPEANPLIFPLPMPVHNTFQIGEFDLFLSSKLSRQVSAITELVIGSDQTNAWGVDIERLQITFKPSPYLEISGGRYHTAIGYYSTAFHHGTWFQTATGRPFMYFFEDSGGILPIHSVGFTATGLVPRTGPLELHWIAEVGNGRSSNASLAPVQNFLADKDHKDFNIAAYIKPDWIPGLQIGGSYYRDRLVPPGILHVNQAIGSFYVVYNNSAWEFLNEAVLITNKMDAFPKSFHSPWLTHKFPENSALIAPTFGFNTSTSPRMTLLTCSRAATKGHPSACAWILPIMPP